MTHGEDKNIDSYALLTIAEYYQWKKRNVTKVMQFYVRLYQNGDPQVRRFDLNNRWRY
jgi:hypothetical protein